MTWGPLLQLQVGLQFTVSFSDLVTKNPRCSNSSEINKFDS